MATNTVDQSRLVLNAFAAIFENNLLSKDIVTWKQFDNEMSDLNGLKVSEQVGPRYLVYRTTGGVKDLSGGVQDTTFGSETFICQDTFNSSMGWGDFQKITSIGEARESTALKNAATQLAEQIDAYILKSASLAANNEVGTAGNNVTTLTDVLSAYTRLKKEGVEDSDLRMVLSYDDQQALAGNILTLTSPDALVTSTYRKGFEGSVGGLPTMFTQQLSNITAGTHTGGAVDATSPQNVNYKDVAISTTNGQYMSQTLAVEDIGIGLTVNDGEVFTIAGVYAWDNRLQQAHSHLQQFRVIGNYTADGSGNIAAMRVFPAIIIADVANNSAHRTVDVTPADEAAITWRTAANAVYKPRLLIQKQAIVVNTADLITPATDTTKRVTLTDVPMSVRMWRHSDFATGNHSIRFDCALTCNVRDRRRMVLLNGA